MLERIAKRPGFRFKMPLPGNSLLVSHNATIVAQTTHHVTNTTTWLPGNVTTGSGANITLLQQTTSIITTTTRELTHNTTASVSLKNITSPEFVNNTLPEVIIDEPEVFSNESFENANVVVIGAVILVTCLAVLGLILRITMPLMRARLKEPDTQVINTTIDDTDPALSHHGHVSEIKFGAHAWAESSSSGSQDWSDVSSSQTKITDDGDESQSKSSDNSGSHRVTPPSSVLSSKGSTISLYGSLLHDSLDPATLENRFRSRWSDHDHWETQSYRPNSSLSQHPHHPSGSRLSVLSVSSSASVAKFPLPTRAEVQHILMDKSKQYPSKFSTPHCTTTRCMIKWY